MFGTDLYISVQRSRLVKNFLNRSNTPDDQLTAREQQTLQLVAEGKTTKEVANVLGISIKTAESHRTRLMSKLDIHDTVSTLRHSQRDN